MKMNVLFKKKKNTLTCKKSDGVSSYDQGEYDSIPADLGSPL